MHMFIIVFGICWLGEAHPNYYSGDSFQLYSGPDIADFNYPLLTIQELGEYALEEYQPEIIKIVKTVQVKVPVPHPQHVPENVPYLLAYKVPQIIKELELVKASEPVPIKVVKPISVSKSNEESHEESHEEQKQDVKVDISADSSNEKASVDSTSFSSNNDDGSQDDWQGISSPSYTTVSHSGQNNFTQKQENHSKESEKSDLHEEDNSNNEVSSSVVQQNLSTNISVENNEKQSQ